MVHGSIWDTTHSVFNVVFSLSTLFSFKRNFQIRIYYWYFMRVKSPCVFLLIFALDFTHQQMFASLFITGTKHMTKLSLGNPNILNIIYLYMYIHKKRAKTKWFSICSQFLGHGLCPLKLTDERLLNRVHHFFLLLLLNKVKPDLGDVTRPRIFFVHGFWEEVNIRLSERIETNCKSNSWGIH